MSWPVKKMLQFCVPLLAVAAGFVGVIPAADNSPLGFILGTLPFWAPVVLGYLSPRLFWLSAIGFVVGPFWAETQPLPSGRGDGFSSPLAVLLFALFIWLPVALALTGGGAVLRKIIRDTRKKRQGVIPPPNK